MSAAVLRDQIKGTLVALSLQLMQNHAVRTLEKMEVYHSALCTFTPDEGDCFASLPDLLFSREQHP
jgi:hypothetical protein